MVVALVAVVCSLVAGPAVGAVRFVDDDGPNDPGPGNPLVSDPLEDGSSDHPFDSIQEAIDAAKSGVDEVLVRDGTYRGLGNVNVDFFGKAIVVHSLNGPAETVVDCEGAAETRGFVFRTNELRDSVLQGFKITRGNMSGAPPAQRRGGAIYCGEASPTIRSCFLFANSASEGGAFGSSHSQALFVRCRFEQNVSTGDGGAFYSADGGYPTLINTVFRDNAAGGSGGAMYHRSCSFGDGPGPYLINCLIANNTAQETGGGVASIEYCGTTVNHCTITGNTAAAGGGIMHELSFLFVRNSILWGNTPDAIDGPMDGLGAEMHFSNAPGGFEGEGNIDVDPLFVDAMGGDYRLAAGSPSVDTGGPAVFRSDFGDLDGDGITNEPHPFDLDDSPRVKGARLDMGAFERGQQGEPIPAIGGWGFALMAITLMIAGSIMARNGRAVPRDMGKPAWPK